MFLCKWSIESRTMRRKLDKSSSRRRTGTKKTYFMKTISEKTDRQRIGKRLCSQRSTSEDSNTIDEMEHHHSSTHRNRAKFLPLSAKFPRRREDKRPRASSERSGEKMQNQSLKRRRRRSIMWTETSEGSRPQSRPSPSLSRNSRQIPYI